MILRNGEKNLLNMTDIEWNCFRTWKESAYNTLWCLIGCSIGDFGTIFAFQLFAPEVSMWIVMPLAIFNGLLTSIILETVILMRQAMDFKSALDTAFKMSFVSMVAMELSMNITDLVLVGGTLTWWVVPIMLAVGFLVPWPYNYYRLKKYGIACH